MNLLNKLTIKSLKLNKKRTIVTIIGIMLSVALITAVATMYSSMIKSLINLEVAKKGHFHVAYYNVPASDVKTIANNRGIETLYLTQDIGYAYLKGSKNEYKPYIFVKAFTNDALNNLSINLVEGRLPKNESEIVIPTHLKTNGRVVMNIGDTLTIDVGKRIAHDGYELKQNNPYQKFEDDETSAEKIIETTKKTYKIVGIIERPASNVEDYSAPGYTFITYINEKDIQSSVDVYAKYNKKGIKNHYTITANILNIDPELYKIYSKGEFIDTTEEKREQITNELAKAKYEIDTNNYLIMLETNPLGESSVGSLGLVVAIVIIIILVTSIFCIKNSIDISITEKIKQYGMLRSIGATKKQIRRNVYYEGTILGLIGIPLGLLLGLIASAILVVICNILLKDTISENTKIVLSYSWISFAISLILGIITIFFSSLKSAHKAAKVSPIESIRNSAELKIKAKKIKCPKIIRKIFKIGGEISYKNMKRNQKKYRTTNISIILSVSVFIALSYFINIAFATVKEEITMYDYNLSLHMHHAPTELEEKAKETVLLDNINDYAIYRDITVNIKNPKYNEEYIKIGNYDSEYMDQDSYLKLLTIGEYQYKKYLKSLNLDYNEFKDKGILIDYEKIYYLNKKNKNVETTLRKFAYEKDDILNIYTNGTNETALNIEIGYITSETPFGFSYYESTLIVSDETFDKLASEYLLNIYFQSSNPDKLQDDIDIALQDEDYGLNNVAENAKIMKNLYTLIAIFLYGFIIVISLIGITNIFNTITTNMSLRRQEFAMLKSIGMTNREFNNMIRFESIFIGLKSLLFGIPIGLGLSYLQYKVLNSNNELATFNPPFLAVIMSIIVVYLLIAMLMKYSMNKINKQNTIETIRNENI